MDKLIINLIKGFFRSIVNQIGRDAGRKVSKKIFEKKNRG